jgi:Fe-S-cluster-containing dehydrogenase component
MNQGYPEGLGIQVGGNAYTPAGQVLEGQYHYEPEAVPEKDATYMPIACMQCEKPPCVKVCPVRTTYREADGPVVIDYNWCIGCKMCMNACPYWARRFNLTTPVLPKEAMNPVTHYLGNRPRMRGVVEKCHWCLQRTRHGRYPACVEVCPVGARKFGNLLDPESEVSKVLARKNVFRLKAESTPSRSSSTSTTEEPNRADEVSFPTTCATCSRAAPSSTPGWARWRCSSWACSTCTTCRTPRA